MASIPRSLQVAYTLFILVWVPAVVVQYGPSNFLWFCDVANFVLLVALWRRSALLVSSQAVGVLLFQAVWWADYFGRLLLGFHPISGTEYMFDPALPLWLRSLSLFHLAIPFLLLWALARLGYHRRGWRLQCALAAPVFLLSAAVSTPELNLNWVNAPFGFEQVWLPPWLYVIVAWAAVCAVVFYGTHLLLLGIARWRRWRIWGEGS
jgi:hypothetical protein